MHLGLIDGPFVPCNLISAQDSPVPLAKFQMAPRLKKINILWVQEWNPDILFFSLKNIPARESPPGSKMGPL
jgi:hypothetical protein